MTSSTGEPIAVSGLGCVSAWGVGTEALWLGLLSSRTGISRLSRFPVGDYPSQVAGQCNDSLEDLRHLTQATRGASRADIFALAAAQQAMAQASLNTPLSGRRIGVYFGGSTGGLEESETYYSSLRTAESRHPSVHSLLAQPVGSPCEAVARTCAATGPVVTVSSACASGTLALGLALADLRSGEVDIALAGGSDSLARTTYGGFSALRSLDPEPCRPFRANRAGLSLGEGGAVLVLERRSSLEARQGTALAHLMGTGTSADAHHMTAPHPQGDGAVLALEACLRDAGIDAGDVDFINAHGTGTPLNDQSEFKALKQLFADGAGSIPVVASKASIGHLLGSAGAIEAVVTVLCLQNQKLHPVPSAGPVDPDAAVNLVQDDHRQAQPLRTGLSLSLGFGGSNAAALFSMPPSP